MKLKTHDIFNTGCLTLAGTLFTVPIYSFLSAMLISVSANNIIDKYGHERNGFGMPVRTYRTHSPVRALFWGFIPALLLFTAVYYIKKGYEPFFPTPYFILLQGLLSGELHLLLDLPTNGGIFINKKRFALGHFAYNNPLINFAAVAAGLFLIYISFTGGNYAKDYNNIKYIFWNFRRQV